MAAAHIKAFWVSGSAPARRMLIALEEKGLKYESVQISFSNTDYRTGEYLKMNPRGKVPTLLDGDIAIYESLAIIEYLDRAYPDKPLLPKNRQESALALTRMHEASYLESAIVDLTSRYSTQVKKEDWKKEVVEPMKKKVFDELAMWETHLKGKQFLAGDNISLADVAVYPWLSYAVRFGLILTDFPSVASYVERFDKRQSAINSYPPHWKDTTGNNIFGF